MKRILNTATVAATLAGALLAQPQGSALAAAGEMAAAAAVTAVADPLNTPARASALASRALMLALAQAGKRLVAVGERGIVLYSDDQGAHWRQAAVPVAVTLTAVFFADARHGFAVGHDGVVLSSSDGGASWNKRLDGNALNTMLLADAELALNKAKSEAERTPDNAAAKAALQRADNRLQDVQAGAKFGPSRPWLGAWFRNANEGYLVGAYGQALTTSDGGAHWTSVADRIDNPDGLHFNAISHLSGDTLAIAGEGGKVYRSGDGGEHWQTLDTGYQGQLYGVAGLPGGAMLAYGFGGHLLRSEDSGQHWQALTSPTKRALIAAAWTRSGALLLATRDGGILLSTDQGRSFSLAVKGEGRELAAATLVDGGAMALAGRRGVVLVTVPGVSAK